MLGEPGIGKTALLQDLESSQQIALGGETTRWLRTRGVESESPLPFAALHRLVRPVVDFDRIPGRHAHALRVAFGLEDGHEDGHEVEPFMVGMATLSVLTDAAENGTLVCIVDDAHWLDAASADALLFAARQLDADRQPAGAGPGRSTRPSGDRRQLPEHDRGVRSSDGFDTGGRGAQ